MVTINRKEMLERSGNNLIKDNKIIIFKTEDGQVEIELRLEDENV